MPVEKSPVVFFDIGKTLADVARSTSGVLVFDVYDCVIPILKRLREEGAGLGIISNTGKEKPENVTRLIREGFNKLESDVFDSLFVNPEFRIYSSEVGLEKNSPFIFELAAGRAGRIAGALPGNCLFVGEDGTERGHAIKAGLRVAPHPSLALEVLIGIPLEYVHVDVASDRTLEELQEVIKDLSFVPIYASVDGSSVYAITTPENASKVEAAGFKVNVIGAEGDPDITDAYLLRGYVETHNAGFMASLGGNKYKLDTPHEGLILALPATDSIDKFRFSASHGRNLRLLPNIDLLKPMPLSAAWTDVISAVLTETEVTELINEISSSAIKQYIERFTGVDPLLPGLGKNRHVKSPQMSEVENTLARELEKIGNGAFHVTLHQFPHGGRDLHNVVAELPGETKEIVLVTAHLDSTSESSYGQDYDPRIHDAPGGDDDASGIAGVLAIARAFSKIFKHSKPKRTVRFVLFNSEEAGLFGSEQYARNQRQAGADIAAVFQMDMIGYNVEPPNSFEVHVGYHDAPLPEIPEVERRATALADLINKFTAQFKTTSSTKLELPQIYKTPDGAAGHSDHSSFLRKGYPACVVSEDFFPGSGIPPESNPYYHSKDDTVAYVNYDYAADIARSVGAAALVMADPK